MPAQIQDIYRPYPIIIKQSNTEPLVCRQMHDRLANLAMLEILNRQSRNEG